jgi:hypothetical protein
MGKHYIDNIFHYAYTQKSCYRINIYKITLYINLEKEIVLDLTFKQNAPWTKSKGIHCIF